MIKKFIWTTLIIFICYSVYSQSKTSSIDINYLPYYQKASEANAYYKNKEYSNAFEVYTELYKEFKPIIGLSASDYRKYIKSAYLSNSCYSEFAVMKTLIVELGYKKASINEDDTLKRVFKKSGIDNEIYELLRNRYLTSIDYDLREKVIDIIKLDQKYRKNYKGDDMIAKMKRIDSINLKALSYIFENHGYPNASLIGHGNISEKRENVLLTFVLRHVDDTAMEDYLLPKLRYFIKKGEFLPSLYKSIYDSYAYRNRIPSTYVVSSKLSKEEVNKNRYEAGLKLLD